MMRKLVLILFVAATIACGHKWTELSEIRRKVPCNTLSLSIANLPYITVFVVSGKDVWKSPESIAGELKVYVPMYLLFGIVAVFPGTCLGGFVYARSRRYRRRRRGECLDCGYNLTGNVSGVCPECGTAIRPQEEVGTNAS
jgi:predicted RNA-binding Zn-ribbon protein involved in translation (DUF1610 family)